MFQIQNYINGKLVDPVGHTCIDNYNPAIGEVYSRTPDSDERDIEAAVEAATGAFPDWSTKSQNP